jgi:hypothetical protein
MTETEVKVFDIELQVWKDELLRANLGENKNKSQL